MADAEKWASGISVPPYAIDDQTAIQVTDGTVELVPGGLLLLRDSLWRLVHPEREEVR